jgi:membrane associated rhomboid family serine protease
VRKNRRQAGTRLDLVSSDVTSIAAILILMGVVAYLMTPEERARVARATLDRLRRLRPSGIEREPIVCALKARTRYPLVTVTLIVVNTAVFAWMQLGHGAGATTLIDWGANFPPRTTNTEWWRLVTALFVHAGSLHLLATLAGLAPLGMTLERLVGPVAFASVYLSAGLLSGVVSLYSAPVGVSVGPSGAIFGEYGLLTATLMWGIVARPSVRIPVALVNMLGVSAVGFILYNLWSDGMGIAAETAGFTTGLVAGLLMARGVAVAKPTGLRIARTATAAVIIAIVSAVPLRGLTDVRPDLEAVAAFEQRSAAAYDEAVDRFRLGQATSEALAELIEGSILPELQRVRAPLRALGRFPREQESLVAAAGEYLLLREKAWQLRAGALRRSSMPGLRDADLVERAALEALRRMKAANRL